MLKVSIVCVGKIKEKFIKQGIDEYRKRLSRYCNLDIIEVQDELIPDNASYGEQSIIKKKEAERAARHIKQGSFVFFLDVSGKKLSSEEFSKKLSDVMIQGNSHVTFVIGGSIGFDEDFMNMADMKLSLSDMTFTHQMVRLIILEQIYRAFKIMMGEAYHK